MKVDAKLYEVGVYVQKLDYSCGPCSIINANMELNAMDVSDLEELEKELVRVCKAVPGVGCSNEDVVRGCRHLGFSITETYENSNLDVLEKRLDQGCVVIVNYFNPINEVGHYAPIVSYDEKAFLIRDSALGLIRMKKKPFERLWRSGDGLTKKWFVAIR